MKVLSVIGARPQIIKAAALSRAISGKFSGKINEVIVHTGQHYDENMSEVFFSELGIPKPNYNMGVGSGNHGAQTAGMIERLEEIVITEKPQCVVLYGDTNSTLAGAVVASKLHVPVVHIEAGLRSFNKEMPEEINRIMCDHVSTLLFSPTKAGVNNLEKEGFKLDNVAPFNMNNPKVYHCGDVMYDNSLYFSTLSQEQSTITKRLNLSNFVLATVHRNDNTDNKEKLSSILDAFIAISDKSEVVFPAHPRTMKMMEQLLEDIFLEEVKSKIKLIEPVSFLDMIALEQAAEMILTDSGGVQKESFYFKKPCIILRPQTEWIELVENGNAIIADSQYDKIISAFDHFATKPALTYPSLYGDGKAAEFICEQILKQIS